MRRDLSALNDSYELVVVGGGIYGVWSALDASLRGVKTLLIDKGDWGSGTSSASSKLLHGGLRYLEKAEFGLVKKSLHERFHLYQIARHRVRPLEFCIPLYKGGRVAPWKWRLGLGIYDYLAGEKKFQSRRFLTKKETEKDFSLLDQKGLIGAACYGDCQMDDGHFLLEVLETFINSGGVAVNYLALQSYQRDGLSFSLNLKESLNSDCFVVNTQSVINATGRWAHDWQEALPKLRFSKGIHLILPDCGLQEALLLLSPKDGRVFFVIPWYGRTMIGTTDTDYQEGLDAVGVDEEDRSYLLEAVNAFLVKKFRREDVVSDFAGLRVMQWSDDQSPSAVSRDWRWIGEKGLWASVGGKYTSARADASKLVDQVVKYLERDVSCQTADHLLSRSFSQGEEDELREAFSVFLSQEATEQLLGRYGLRSREILVLYQEDSDLAKFIDKDLLFTWGELLFSAREEMALTLDDLCRRRLPLKILTRFDEALEREICQFLARYELSFTFL